MRKLKLHMRTTVDGCVAGPQRQVEGMAPVGCPRGILMSSGTAPRAGAR